jgi:hypothetical protein
MCLPIKIPQPAQLETITNEESPLSCVRRDIEDEKLGSSYDELISVLNN